MEQIRSASVRPKANTNLNPKKEGMKMRGLKFLAVGVALIVVALMAENSGQIGFGQETKKLVEHFVFLIDISGSMGEAPADRSTKKTKLELVKEVVSGKGLWDKSSKNMVTLQTALRHVATYADPKVTLITFADKGTIIINRIGIGANELATFNKAVNGLQADGNTNMRDGMEVAKNIVETGNDDTYCIVLISDGFQNQGDVRELWPKEGPNRKGIGFFVQKNGKKAAIVSLGISDEKKTQDTPQDQPGTGHGLLEKISASHYEITEDEESGAIIAALKGFGIGSSRPWILILHTGGGGDCEPLPAPSSTAELPTLTEWGLIALAVLLAGSLAFMIRRRFAPRPAGA